MITKLIVAKAEIGISDLCGNVGENDRFEWYGWVGLIC